MWFRLFICVLISLDFFIGCVLIPWWVSNKWLLRSGFFFFQAEDGIRDVERSRGLGDVYKRQVLLLLTTIIFQQFPQERGYSGKALKSLTRQLQSACQKLAMKNQKIGQENTLENRGKSFRKRSRKLQRTSPKQRLGVDLQLIHRCTNPCFKNAFSAIFLQYHCLIIPCLLYTSDAADDTPCVDLGGRRFLQKKNSTTMRNILRSVSVTQHISTEI
eukprot:TRINITY_DN51476_c0_g1_i1.p1 TRINITY_DN51476_c0_g1~~TRINITY_DN51476_c0_g1_i1.p1  ORF type:complete len:216 (+),score=3.48 TRINITY_DN51476_c0_g1_i1:33-680(+)